MTPFTYIPDDVRFFTNLHLKRTIKNMSYEFRDKTIVYAIRCQINRMVYVGSTFTPGKRFHNHLVTGKSSNEALQADILKYGLQNFTAYVLEVVEMPSKFTYEERGKYLRKAEQVYINNFPKEQLYNSKASSSDIN